jgi:hypothetical protein
MGDYIEYGNNHAQNQVLSTVSLDLVDLVCLRVNGLPD